MNASFFSRLGSFRPGLTRLRRAILLALPLSLTGFAQEAAGYLELNREGNLPESSFGISISPVRLAPPGAQTLIASQEIQVKMTLRHFNQPEPLELNFSSSQSFDIGIYNDRGERVYTWSATRLFLAQQRTERINGEQNWTAIVPVSPQLRPGRYVIEAFLTTEGGPVFRAVVPYTVRR